MVKNHLKAIAAPKMWPVKRKERVFILRPNPGPHALKTSVSLNFLLVDMLQIAKTKKEATSILYSKEVLVNGIKRKEIDFPVGLFDVVTIKEVKKNYRIGINQRGKLTVFEIDNKESNIRPCKISGKIRKGKKTQINFSDGSNVLVEKDSYKVGDSVTFDCSKKSIVEHYELKKGNTIILTGGKHIGSIGVIEDVIGSKIIYKIKEIHETLKEYAFVVGKEKPIIKIEEK